MRSFVKHNGLSIFFLALFLAALVLQAFAGHADFNEDQLRHDNPTMSLGRYVISSEFGVAVLENWQSEYLQFTLFILPPSGCSSAARPSPRSCARRAASRTRTSSSAGTRARTRRAGRRRPTCAARSTRTRC